MRAAIVLLLIGHVLITFGLRLRRLNLASKAEGMKGAQKNTATEGAVV